MTNKINSGFTLIELLVVISIIGLLASVVLVSLNSARDKSKNAVRKATLRQLQAAVEIYYSYNETYPSTSASPTGLYASEVGDIQPNGNNNDGDWIPGLAPTYINKLPKDPEGGASNNSTCTGSSANLLKSYLYRSDGVNYKIISRCGGPTSNFTINDPLYDPLRPDYGWMVCSAEPACSTW